MSDKKNGWVGFDLDGTLAHYDEWRGIQHIGRPIEPMVSLVKQYLEEGTQVKIFTARVSAKSWEKQAVIINIEEWCKRNIGTVLPITNEKDMMMTKCYDDRAIQVEQNTGRIIE